MDALAFIERFIDQLAGLSSTTAYLAIFAVLFACGLGIPVPEDITLIATGVLASMENISLTGGILVCFFGVLIGDAILFALGRRYGRKVFKLPLIRRVFTPDRIEGAEDRIRRNSKFICFIARFLPGLRGPIYLTAGVMGVRPITFILLDGSAALISVPIWVLAGWYFGEALEEALGFAKQIQVFLLGFVGFVIFVYFLLRWRRKQKDIAHRLTNLRSPGESNLKKRQTLVDHNS
jgi:membrane protein DedA with SNARE-associated domain